VETSQSANPLSAEDETRGLSLDEVRAGLPAADSPRIASDGIEALPEQIRLLFKRLGTLRGASALDEIMDTYHETPGFVAGAMTLAIIGWLETDREAVQAVLAALGG